MLLQPIKITLYDPVTQEEKATYQQRVITFAMLTAAVQLQEALTQITEKKARWWWQKPISQEAQQIDALLDLVTQFFGNQFTVAELRTGADVSEVMTVLQAIIARAGTIVQTNPTVPPTLRRKR